MNDNRVISGLRYSISGYLGIFMYLIPVIVVPILSYRFKNWWLLFGIIFAIVGTIVGNGKYRFIVIAVAFIGYLGFQGFEGFDIHKPIYFYLIWLLFGAACIFLYRVIGFGDRASRALIALQNPSARKEIEKEIEEGVQKFKSKNPQ